MEAHSIMDPIIKNFLNAIAGPESSGKYDVRYTPEGGAKFEGFEKHPQIYEPGPAGPSSAAGRYQFTYSTWAPLAAKMGLKDFSPANQDKAAWELARQRYARANKGADLYAALKSGGISHDMLKSLGGTWAAFNSKSGRNKAIKWYGSSPSNPVSAALPGAKAQAASMPTVAGPMKTIQQAVYSPDPLTSAQRIGNFLAPSLISAPKPMTADDKNRLFNMIQLMKAGDSMLKLGRRRGGDIGISPPAPVVGPRNVPLIPLSKGLL